MVCGYVIESVTCVGVQGGKPCCFMINFTTGFILMKRGSKFVVFHPDFGPSLPSPFHTKWNLKAENTGKREFEI